MSRRLMMYTGACALTASAAVVTAIPAKSSDAVAPPKHDTSQFTPESIVKIRNRPAIVEPVRDPAVTPSVLSGPPPGEDCANPILIPSLPYSTTGSTAGMADDYNVICTSFGAGGSDVVYQFDAIADVVVNISLCLNSDFDTRLYVYEDLCGDTPSVIACNEDQCPTPSSPDDVVSQVFDVQLSTGISYFIVIDGFNAIESGNYTLDITLDEPPCPEDSIFTQVHSMPDDAWNFGTSDAAEPVSLSIQGRARAETYSVEEDICDVHWWGLRAFNPGTFTECAEDPMSFTVNFHEDDAGVPGAIACTYDAILTAVPMGMFYIGFELVRFDLDLTDEGCCTLTDGWISIIGGTDVSDDPDCWFLWASSGNAGAPGATHRSRTVDPEGAWVSNPYDLAFCLTPGVPCPGDVSGVSPGEVGIQDLLALLSNWGACPEPCPPNCPADVVPDCNVGIQDLLFVLSNWGPCDP